jgi:chemotaxis protein CheD
MPDKIKVGMADWKVGRDPDILITFGLGSCVALVLWNPQERLGAMAHIMLPDSKIIRYRQENNPAKFGDTAVPIMLAEMEKLGCRKEFLQAKLVGGANMFTFAGKLISGNMNVGQRNVQSVKTSLEQKGVRLVSEDTGGTFGRSVEFYASTGLIRIRTAAAGDKEI